MTVYEIQARQRKVTAMVSLFRSNNADYDALLHLDDTGWSAAAQLVGSKPPSEKTKQMVIETMRSTGETRAKYADDPFRGFPAGTSVQ
jgi:hypothetical protein